MYLDGCPCLKIDRERKLVSFDFSPERERELVEFYDRYLAEDLDYFAIDPRWDPALYKLAEMVKEKPLPELKIVHFDIPGPYTMGLGVRDERGAPAFYNVTMRDVMVKLLAMKVKWRERKIKELFPGVQMLLTLGEGGLAIFGSAGGAGTWDDVKNTFNEIIEATEDITCIHCCANMEWPLLMETTTDIINLDAYQYGGTLSLYTNELKRFLERGGMIAWGIVPTQGMNSVENENPNSLVERLEQIIQSLVDKGIDKQMLLEASWITPTCETIAMPIEKAEMVYDFTGEVSQRMKEKYFG